MAPRRPKHQPGVDRNDHESNQHKKVGQDAKIVMVNSDKKFGLNSPASRLHMKNSIAAGEKKTSISASKHRERGRGY